MARFQTDAVVLKQFDLGEADKIITFYTRDRGKVRAVARGVRKTRSPISGLVLPFSYNQVTIYQGRSLARINHIQGKYSFAALREDLQRMAYASFMAELVEKVGMEDQPDRELFSLLLTSFYRIIKVGDGEINYVELAFKVRLLGILGLQPRLNKCIHCGQEITPGVRNYFSTAGGGLLCRECSPTNSHENLSGEAVRVLQRLLQSGLEPAGNLKISQHAFQQLDEVIDSFLIYHLDFRLNSLDFLHTIKGLDLN